MHFGLLDYAALALQSANSALAPFTPLFRIIDVLLAIHKCLMAIPGILGPPPDPSSLLEALKELAEKLKAILRMLPYLTFPIIIVQMLDMTIALLSGIARELQALARYMSRIEDAELIVADIPGLLPVINCAYGQVDAHMNNLKYILAPINPTIELLNLFAQLAQLGDPFPIPRVDAFPDTGADPEDVAQVLLDIVTQIRSVRDLIPL